MARHSPLWMFGGVQITDSFKSRLVTSMVLNEREFVSRDGNVVAQIHLFSVQFTISLTHHSSTQRLRL